MADQFCSTVGCYQAKANSDFLTTKRSDGFGKKSLGELFGPKTRIRRILRIQNLPNNPSVRYVCLGLLLRIHRSETMNTLVFYEEYIGLTTIVTE